MGDSGNFTYEQETRIHRIADIHASLWTVLLTVLVLVVIVQLWAQVRDLQHRVGQLEQQLQRLEQQR